MGSGFDDLVDKGKKAIDEQKTNLRHIARHLDYKLKGETQILPDSALDAYEDARDKVSDIIPKDVQNFFSDARDKLSETVDSATTTISNAIPKEVKEGVSNTLDNAKRTLDEATEGAGAILATYTGNIDAKETERMQAELTQDSLAFKNTLLKTIKEATFNVADNKKLDAIATALAYTKQTHEFAWKDPKTWVNSLSSMVKAAFSALTKDFDHWNGFDGFKAQLAKNIAADISIDAEKNVMVAYPEIPDKIKGKLLADVQDKSLESAFAALGVDAANQPTTGGNIRPGETPTTTASAETNKARTHG